MGRKEELTREVREQIFTAIAHPEEIDKVSRMIADELALGEVFREVNAELSEQVQHLRLCVPGLIEAQAAEARETCRSALS